MVKKIKSFIDNWRTNFPNPVRTTKVEGDTDYASQFIGEADLLTYQTRNRMKLGKLNQLNAIRRFSDGTQITVKSIFGHDIVNIDVSKVKIAEVEVVEITCSITLFNIPEEIPPMKYPGEIHAGEVEDVDYIKTYYTLDTSTCPTCSDPDFTVCDTAELTAAEADCKPFEFIDATVESKEGEPDNHCVTSTSHCQAEIINFGSDDGGTYFLWKGYTEWGEEFTQSGLGYMLLRGFIKIEGHNDELCTSIETMVQVDCCEKNTDEYKVVHPEWGDLDIECTSLIMGCDEKQTLTAKYGCPPFVWTLVSGGGILTPSVDGLTAEYESPETNPNCNENPTIKLEDRCENDTTLKLAISCASGIAGYHYIHSYVDCSICGVLPNDCWILDGTGACIPVETILSATGYKITTMQYRIYCDSTEVSLGTYTTLYIKVGSNWYTYHGMECDTSDFTYYPPAGGDCMFIGGEMSRYFESWPEPILTGDEYEDIRTEEQKQLGCCPIQFM